MATNNIYQYPVNPGPQTGSGVFGAVPGAIALPQPAQDLSAQYPNLAGTNAALSGDILSKLNGQLSPGTLQQLQSASATYGAANGMPGQNAVPGTMPYSFGLESLGLNSEQQAQQGIQDYNSTIPTVSGTQTVNPGLQVQVAEENALNAAAPNPAAAQSYAQQLYEQYLQRMGSPGKSGGAASAPSTRWPSPGADTGSGALPGTGFTTTGGNTASGSFYNGVWYPAGTTPTANLTPTNYGPYGSPDDYAQMDNDFATIYGGDAG